MITAECCMLLHVHVHVGVVLESSYTQILYSPISYRCMLAVGEYNLWWISIKKQAKPFIAVLDALDTVYIVLTCT